MTAEHIHDALTLLPADLIAEADRKRSGKPRVIPWKRYAAMAACFLLVLCCGWYSMLMFGSMGGAKETAAIPTMAAAESRSDSARAEAPAEEVMEAAPQEPAAAEEEVCGLPTAPASGSVTADKEHSDLCIDHAHSPAEPFEDDTQASSGWCGNMTATVYYGEHVYTLSGSGAVTLTDILYHLTYDPEKLCRCMAEITVDTEMGAGYEINLEEYFVRFEGGQAALTPEQAAELKRALQNVLPLSYSTHQVITPSLDGYSDHDVTLITSRQELEDYWERFSDRYDFFGMQSLCGIYGYDDDWFREHDLLLTVVYSRVGVTYDVTSITDVSDSCEHGWEWEVLVSLKGEYYPDNEETTYHLLTRLEKGIMSPDDDIIGVMDTRGMEPYLYP